MTEEEKVDVRGKRSWLHEHDSIQSELLKMKDEILLEGEGETLQRAKPRSSDVEKRSAQPKPEVPKKEPVQSASPRPDGEMTIKQLLGSEQPPRKDKHKEAPREGVKEKKDPVKLDDGVIPASPDLSSKIANVLQLENDLKRRKFELEKRAGARSIPPPPVRPGSDTEEIREKKIGEAEGGRDTIPQKIREETSHDGAGNTVQKTKVVSPRKAEEAVDLEGSKEKAIPKKKGPETPPESIKMQDKKLPKDSVEGAETKQEKEGKEPQEKKRRRGIFGWFSR